MAEPVAQGPVDGPLNHSPGANLHKVVPSWGLGEVALGLALGQALSLVGAVVVFSLGGWASNEEVPLWAGAILQIPLWAGWSVALVAAHRKGNGLVEDLGIRTRVTIDAPVGLVIGIAVQLLVLPLLYLPLLWLLGRTTEDLSAPARELTDKAQGAAGWIVLSLIVVVGAPLFEEVFYRGLLLRALQKRGLANWLACLAGGAVFAAMHLQGLQFAGLFLFGTVLSVLVVRTDRLGMAVFAHAAFNATTVVTLYLLR